MHASTKYYAFVGRDVTLAQEVLSQDDWLDALKGQVFRERLAYMLSNPSTVEPGVDLILISRHLERVCDHATNIAEDVIFLVEARDVRHRSSPYPSSSAGGTRERCLFSGMRRHGHFRTTAALFK